MARRVVPRTLLPFGTCCTLADMKTRLRWSVYAISAVGLFVYLWGFSGQFQHAALPNDFPLEQLPYPVTVEGLEVGAAEDLSFVAGGLGAGSTVTIEDASGGSKEILLRRTHSLAHLMISFFCGIAFWIVSTFFFAPRADTASIRDFYWCVMLYGLAVMIGGVYHPGANLWPGALLGVLRIVSLAALPLVFIHLALIFPRRAEMLDRRRWFLPSLWGLAAILIAWQAFGYLRYCAHPSAAFGQTLALPRYLATAILVAEVAVGLLFLFASWRRLELARERKQVKWLLWGFTLGVAPYVFLRAVFELLGMPSPLTPQVDRLFALAIPTAFLFTIVRFQFLDIDIIIRRSLIYGILAAVAIGLYLAVGVLAGRLLERVQSGWQGWLLLVIGLLAGVMFNPLRHAIGRWVDRTFFKIRHDYERALTRLQREIQAASGQRELIEAVTRFIQDSMRLNKQAIILGGDSAVIWAGDVDAKTARDFAVLAADEWSTSGPILALPNSCSQPEIESEQFPARLAREGFVLGHLILLDGENRGLILLGAKRTERRLVEPDIDAIRECADLTASGLDRLGLVRAVAEEALARQRLHELNQLKSDFLSRVAHDLRTPLASVSWSADNLLDGVSGELNESQADYLRSIKASSGHLARMVSNLLEISRLERAQTQLDTEPVDLRLVIDRAIKTLRPLAAEKQVRFQVEQVGPMAPVLGNEDKLVEVAMNLLDNAVKYTPEDSAIEILIGTLEAGGFGFSVRDHGPGLGSGDVSVLFERFEQGTPSPHSQQHGFGLGLHIVKSYLELMDGEARAANHPAGGAVFTCLIPADAEGEDS